MSPEKDSNQESNANETEVVEGCLAGSSNEAPEDKEEEEEGDGDGDSVGKPCCRIPWRGCLALLGGFLIQLTLGSFYSFGNMMTYLTSYMR